MDIRYEAAILALTTSSSLSPRTWGGSGIPGKDSCMQGRHVSKMSKIRVAATEPEPRGQVKLATDHRPSMARPWISALAFKKKKKRKKKKEERGRE